VSVRGHLPLQTAAAGHPIMSWRRLLMSLVGGLVSGGVVAALDVPELSFLVGWGVAASVVLMWVWRISWPEGDSGTTRLAENEGRTRVTDTAVLAAAVASLIVVLEGLITSSHQDTVAVASVVLSVVDIILSWAVVNTVFTLRYARLYFAGGDGGIAFHLDEPPVFSDFAYVAFTVGCGRR